jgi:hypothetical protein
VLLFVLSSMATSSISGLFDRHLMFLKENDSNQNSTAAEKKIGEKLPAVGSSPSLAPTNGNKHSNGFESPRLGRRFDALPHIYLPLLLHMV